MAVYINQSKFAESLGVTPAAICIGIKQKRIHKIKQGINPEHPTNILYAESVRANKAGAKEILSSSAAKRGPRKSKKSAPKTEPAKPEEKPPKKMGRPPGEPIITDEPDVDVSDLKDVIKTGIDQKLQEDIRLKKITADLKSLDYMNKLDVLIDSDTLLKIFSPFYDFLLTELIHMPEEIADMLWMQAKDSDDPEKKIADLLKDRIEQIVKRAKDVAEGILPEKGMKRRYVSIEEKE